MNEKFILDACCGGRMMWTDKHHPNAVYIDIRTVNKGYIQQEPNHEVNPDYVMDFRKMSFQDKSFKLVVFDPPHLTSLGKNSIFSKKFGCLNAETWQNDLQRGFSECWRVLDNYGVLVFKWSDVEIPYKKVLSLIKIKPLFYNISAGGLNIKKGNRTYWFCFMKIPSTPEQQEGGNHETL